MLYISNFMLCINNYLLELYNLIYEIMRKPIMILLLAGLMLFTVILRMFQTNPNANSEEMNHFVLMLILVGLGTIIGIYRLKKQRQGVPSEDEFSKKILNKASSASFYLSIFMWVAMNYIFHKLELNKDLLVMTGVLGMSVLFCSCWVYYRVWGTRDV